MRTYDPESGRSLTGANIVKLKIADENGEYPWTLVLSLEDRMGRAHRSMELVLDSKLLEESIIRTVRSDDVYKFLDDEECELLKVRGLNYLKRDPQSPPNSFNRELQNIDLTIEEIETLLSLKSDDVEKGMEQLRRKKVYRKFGL